MASLYTHPVTPSSGSEPTQGALSDPLCPSLQAEDRPELWGTPNPAALGVPEACQGPHTHGHPLWAGVGGVPQETDAESDLHQCHRYRRPTSPPLAGRGCLLAGESRSHQKLRSPRGAVSSGKHSRLTFLEVQSKEGQGEQPSQCSFIAEKGTESPLRSYCQLRTRGHSCSWDNAIYKASY